MDYAKYWDSDTIKSGVQEDILDAQAPPIDGKSGDGRRLLGRLIATWD